MIYNFADKQPKLGANVFIAPGAQIIGDVTLGAEVSVWHNAVLRGDTDAIVVGSRTNIQDLSVLHTDAGIELFLAEDVSIGHSCVLHGCRIGAGSLVGIGAVILNHAVIGDHCLVAARSLVTERKTFPSHTLIMGSPARVARELTAEELAGQARRVAEYVRRAARHREALSQIIASSGGL
ncbi:MAG: gamma carbonic anhydrase family protein [Gracilibacteraceae bacterium]|jgi:carbonic anhydrase/acetyltransferase-like protein (isoleucine patch superfamily)|nr:gamma carbonic anhydrase family protein [Gracilibacteraceae bacterium]